jgi:hypothetical protein
MTPSRPHTFVSFWRFAMVALLLLGGLLVYEFRTRMTRLKTIHLIPQNPSHTIPGDSDIIAISTFLNELWARHLGEGEWFYVAYEDEFFNQDVGIDFERNIPLPTHALTESWFRLDASGLPTTVLTRRTDIDRKNVWLAVWEDNTLLQLPNETLLTDYMWDNRPISDNGCHRLVTANPPINDEIDLLGEWIPVADGREQWHLTLITEAVRHTCVRDGTTGAVQLSELWHRTADGIDILMQRDRIRRAEMVAEPPIIMLDLLPQLAEARATHQRELFWQKVTQSWLGGWWTSLQPNIQPAIEEHIWVP